MSFEIEALDIFKAKVLSLYEEFTKQLGRYPIGQTDSSQVDQQSASSSYLGAFFPAPPPTSPHLKQFETLLKQIDTVSKSKSSRNDEKAAFRKLHEEYSQLNLSVPEALKKPVMVMLGLLLYRYFRIVIYYTDSVGIFSTPLKCGLLKSIRAALGFTFIGENQGNYRTQEGKILDAVTVVEALTALRDKMTTTVKGDLCLYQTYPHLSSNDGFLSNIDILIAEYTKKDEEKDNNLKQYAAIRFIVSLVQRVDEVHKIVEKEIDAWSEKFKQSNPSITHITSINNDEDAAALKLEANRHIADIKLAHEHLLANTDLKYFKVLIPQLLNSNYFEKLLLNKPEFDQFIKALKAAQWTWASYVVFGGIALLLDSKNINSVLKRTIMNNVVSGCLKENDNLKEQYLLRGINRTITFLNNNTVDLDCEFFVNYSQFQKALFDEQTSLNDKIAQQQQPAPIPK